MSVYRIVISNDDNDEVVGEFVTSETLTNIQEAVENNLSVYSTRAEHDDAGSEDELSLEEETCGECGELLDDCTCDEEDEDEGDTVERGRE